MVSPPYEALTRLELARLLLTRRAGDDLVAADRELECALGIAERIGMAPLAEAASGLLAQHRRGRSSPLSVRETELAGLIADGLSNRQIAQRLFLSERTVETHVRNILTKLGFDRRSQVASWMTARSARL